MTTTDITIQNACRAPTLRRRDGTQTNKLRPPPPPFFLRRRGFRANPGRAACSPLQPRQLIFQGSAFAIKVSPGITCEPLSWGSGAYLCGSICATLTDGHAGGRECKGFLLCTPKHCIMVWSTRLASRFWCCTSVFR